MSTTSQTYSPAHGGYPGTVRSGNDTCMSAPGRACMAGGYVHLVQFHDAAVTKGRAKLAEAMSR